LHPTKTAGLINSLDFLFPYPGDGLRRDPHNPHYKIPDFATVSISFLAKPGSKKKGEVLAMANACSPRNGG